jgi:hypothetical protein
VPRRHSSSWPRRIRTAPRYGRLRPRVVETLLEWMRSAPSYTAAFDLPGLRREGRSSTARRQIRRARSLPSRRSRTSRHLSSSVSRHEPRLRGAPGFAPASRAFRPWTPNATGRSTLSRSAGRDGSDLPRSLSACPSRGRRRLLTLLIGRRRTVLSALAGSLDPATSGGWDRLYRGSSTPSLAAGSAWRTACRRGRSASRAVTSVPAAMEQVRCLVTDEIAVLAITEAEKPGWPRPRVLSRRHAPEHDHEAWLSNDVARRIPPPAPSIRLVVVKTVDLRTGRCACA